MNKNHIKICTTMFSSVSYQGYSQTTGQMISRVSTHRSAALVFVLLRGGQRGRSLCSRWACTCFFLQSMAGQSGLARFIKLPPVDPKKIPDIVKYEAKQQIPFALEDVVWDYQPMPTLSDDGFDLETEVGLFAMKRDQVFRTIQPLIDAEVELDIIQLSPLAIYNAMVLRPVVG